MKLKIVFLRNIKSDFCSPEVFLYLCEHRLLEPFRNIMPHHYCKDGIIYTSRKRKFLKRELKNALQASLLTATALISQGCIGKYQKDVCQEYKMQRAESCFPDQYGFPICSNEEQKVCARSDKYICHLEEKCELVK